MVLFWLPGLVGQRIAAKIEARTGVPAHVDGVALRMSSVAIDSLVVGGGKGEFALRAKQIRVEGSPLQLALRGTRAVRGLEVETVDVQLPLEAQSSRTLLTRLRSRPDGGEAPEADSGSGPRSVRVGRVGMLVSDAHGELARVENASAQLEAGRVRVDVQRVRAGQQPGGQLLFQRLSAEAQRTLQGYALERATLGDAQVWLPAIAPEDAATPQTVPRSLERLRAVVPASAQAATAPTPAAAPGAAAARPLPGAVSRALAKLAQDALLTLESATIYGSGQDAAPILQKLRASLKIQPGNVLLFSGRGSAQADGALHWDLVVRPEELRADGEVELKALPLTLLAPALPGIPWYEPEFARVDAAMRIKTGPDGIAFDGQASLRDAAIESARIAATPVRGIDIGVRGRGRLLPLQHRLEIADGEFSLSRASIRGQGAAEWSPDHYLFNIDATLPPTSCTDVVQSVPEDVLGDMALATWKGKIGGQFRLRLDSRQLEETELSVKAQDHCQFETVPVIADLRRFGKPFVHSVLEPDDSVFEMETGPGTEAWTDIEQISPYLVHAILAHEDIGFFSHSGFSMRHIRDALVRNLQERRYVVGASTITMQLVKNVFLHREKTLSRKIQEVLLTWWLERVMEKRDILELYLNVIEYGPQVYGIRNAAEHYFSRPPSDLSPGEAVWLAHILPNPKQFHRQMVRGSISKGFADMMRKMLIRLRDRGSIAPESAEYGIEEVEHFRFAPAGTPVQPREIPGWAAPLPYMRGADQNPATWEGEDAMGVSPDATAAP